MTVHQAPPRSVRPTRTASVTTSRAVLLGSGMAWVALGVMTVRGWLDQSDMAGHMHHPGHAGPVDPWSLAWVGTWLVMVAAMMWPLAVPALAAVSRATFDGWRTRLVVTCLGTVTILWLAFGLVAASVARAVSVPVGNVWWQLAWVGAAVLVLRSARRARLLWKCLQLPPLAPGGRRGVVSAARAGLVSWRRCALLCGPVMTAMVVGHNPLLMVCASLAAWWEASHPRAWHDRVPVLLLGAAAVWLAATVTLGEVVGHV